MTPQMKTVKLAMVVGELLRRSQAASQEKVASANKINTLIPQVAQTLEDFGRINKGQKDLVATKLAGHSEALEILELVARQVPQAVSSSIGSPSKPAEKLGEVQHAGQRVANYDDTEAGRRFRDSVMNGRK